MGLARSRARSARGAGGGGGAARLPDGPGSGIRAGSGLNSAPGQERVERNMLISSYLPI